MSDRFGPAGDALADDAAAMSALEFSDANDIDESVQAYANAVQAMGYLGILLVGRLEETGLHPDIINRVFETAHWIDVYAGDIEDLLTFSLADRR